jgi:carbon monoxide dehydrogenase subunit G
MKLEQTFDVKAPLEQVWAALNDLERVAPCLPGAEITSHDEDGTYHGTFTVKLGPMTAAYNGTIKIEDVDEAAHRATLKAKGTDKRGQGGANATIVNTLSEHEGATRVEAVTDFNITGRLAQFGRGGIMQDVSNRLLRDFATCLSTRLAEPSTAPAAESAGTAPGGSPAPADEVAAAGTKPPSTPPPAAAPPPTQPLKGGSLFFSVLWERIKRLFKRG